MDDGCFICTRIDMIKKGNNLYFVKELSTGYVVIGDNQYYHGLTFFLAKKHANELHAVPKQWRDTFLSDMADAAAAMAKTFEPRKINYELLGNKDEHMHRWLIPRHADDPNPGMPIWVMDKEQIFGPDSRPSGQQLAALVEKLRRAF